MAQVPEPTGARVAPSDGALPLENISANSGAFGAPIAQGLGHVAESVDKTSELFDQHAKVLAALNNKANVDQASIATDDANNKVFVDFTTNQRGQNAVPGLQPAIDAMNANRAKQRATLTNPTAQAAFDASTLRTQKVFEGEMYRHAASEQNAYVTTSSTDAITSAGELYAANPNSPAMEANYLETVKTQSNFLAKHQGLDGPNDSTHADILAKKAQGQVFSEVARNLSQTNPPAADAFLDAHKDLMDPKSYTQAKAGLKPVLMSNDAATVADAAVDKVLGHGTVSSAQSNPQAFFSNIAGGQVTVTSGVRTPEHNAEVGGVPNSEHLAQNGVAYDLVPPKGMTTAEFAAKVRAAVPDAHQVLNEGDHVHVGWNLAAVRAASVNSAAGGSPTSADLQGNMARVLAEAGTAAQAKYPGNQQFQDTVEARAMAKLNRQIGAAKDVETSAYTQLGSMIMDHNIQDLDTLLKQPGNLAAFNTLPLAQRTALQLDVKRNASEVTPQRYENINLLNGMYANRVNNPSAFLNIDIASMDLPMTTKIQFLKQQEALRNRPGNVDPNSKFIAQVTKTPEFRATLSALDIKPNSKGEMTDNYAHLIGSLAAEREAWDAQNPGKSPSPKDTSGMIARATAAQTSHKSWFGLGDTIVDSRAFDVSKEDEAAATAYLTAQGRPVNAVNIAHAIRLANIAKGRKNAPN